VKPVPFPVKAALAPETTDALGGVIVAVSERELGSPLPQPDSREIEPRIKATYRRIYVPTLVRNPTVVIPGPGEGVKAGSSSDRFYRCGVCATIIFAWNWLTRSKETSGPL
jgi:hypothetical protein